MTALAGRLALVTGASRGIGAAVAARLATDGATVVRIGRRFADSAALYRDVVADLSTDQGIARALEATLAFGVPDIVVNNAGGFAIGDLGPDTVGVLDELYRINLRAPVAVAGGLLPAMRRRGSGLHLLIGSVADHRAFPGNAAYAATKFGARGFHEVLRAEYAGSGVRCTLVSPGPTDTSLWDPIDPDHRPGFPARSAMLRPEHVAAAVHWLATQPASVDVAWLPLQAS